MKILKLFIISLLLASSARADFYYRIRRGDTLAKIAKRFNVSVKTLIRANHLKPPYYVIAGRKLRIPKRSRKYIYYRVKRGDSLEKIAKRFKTSVREIKHLNHLKRSVIYVGQRLKVPLRTFKKRGKRRSKGALPLRKVPIYRYYRVRRGDSLIKIAKRFKVRVDTIIRVNHLRKPYIIRPGQTLKILVGYKDRLAINRPLKFIMPLDGRIDTTIHSLGYPGIFIVAPPDEPVKASEIGIVKFAGRDNKLLKRFGYIVVLEHPQNFQTIYASLSKITVKPGQLVKRGQVIGYTGDSGDFGETGLYFEISKIHRGKVYQLNPLEILR